jgi:hypothetical protein
MKYIQNKLLQQTEIVHITGNVTKAVIQELTLIGTMSTLTLDNYIAASGAKKERKKPVQSVDSKFREIWDAYPASGNFQYRGMKFTSSRTLRANYQVCEMLYQKALQSKQIVTHEQILEAVKKQVQMVKEESYESGQNRMQYLPSLEVYLRQARYEAMISIEDESEEGYESNSNCA